MAESGTGTAARAKEGQSSNGSDPRASRAGGFGRPSLLRRLFDEIQNRLTADLDDRDPDFIRENLALSWLIASIWWREAIYPAMSPSSWTATDAGRPAGDCLASPVTKPGGAPSARSWKDAVSSG